MTIDELLEQCKTKYKVIEGQKVGKALLDENNQLDTIDCKDVISLCISFSYQGEIPSLSLFPNIKRFSSTKPVDVEYIKNQDFKNLEYLFLNIDHVCEDLVLDCENIKELVIRVENSNERQVSIFDLEQNKIVLANTQKLQCLTIRYCNGIKFEFPNGFSSLEAFSIFNSYCDIDLKYLASQNTMKYFTVCDCGLSSASFLPSGFNYKSLNLSYNEIDEKSFISKGIVSEYLNLYSNPIDRLPLSIRNKPIKCIITKKEKQLNDYEKHCDVTWFAFLMLRGQRDTNNPRSKYYVKYSDQELLIKNIKTLLDNQYEEDQNKDYLKIRYNLISEQDKADIKKKLYPFLYD